MNDPGPAAPPGPRAGDADKPSNHELKPTQAPRDTSDPPPPPAPPRRRRLLPTVRRRSSGVTRETVTAAAGTAAIEAAGPSSTKLVDLPVELLEHAFSALPADALACAAATCRDARAAAASPRLWRRLYELRWGAAAAKAAATADDAPWSGRYASAHAADVAAAAQTATGTALSSMLAQSIAARASVAPPWPPPPLMARRVTAAVISESPAERAAAWRSTAKLPPGDPPQSGAHTAACPAQRWARLPGGPPSLHGCLVCGFVHACAPPACDAAVCVDATGVERVCPISGAVFEGEDAWRGEDAGGGGGDDDDDPPSEYGGRLGRAYAEGYLGQD